MDNGTQISTLAAFAFALLPFAAMIALLRVIDVVARRREVRVARQIALTDAIHAELGAVAAPVVRRRFGGGWLVRMAAPLERPGTTAALVRIAERQFAFDAGTRRLRIVLAPAEARPPSASLSSMSASAPRPAPRTTRVIPAIR
jgi:hypothetical protein